jgi:hypothetical protein
MIEQSVAALSRRAASMSRRGSLLTLGGALAAAIAAPSPVQGEKDKKKSRKKAKRKADQKAAEQAENEANAVCQSQVAGCRAHLLDVCQLPGGRCVAVAGCCSALGTCDFDGFLTCLVAAANS